MTNLSTFIIAEAGVNHNGDPDRALAMVDAAFEAGADAVKFQTFSAEKLVSASAPKAEYQKRETGDGTQLAMLKSLEMSEDLHSELFARCQKLGIEFLSTPFDLHAASFLVGLGMRRIKVPSGELDNLPFIRSLAAYGLPLIVSTGMGTMEEVKEAVETVRIARENSGLLGALSDFLTVLHCTSNYPANECEVNLLAMQSIANETGMPVGYSDHTLGTAVSIAAVACGARVIEKHFTLDKSLSGPDHNASLTVQEFKELVSQVRMVERALGDPVKAPTPSEIEVRKVVRRSITAAMDLPAGSAVTEHNFEFLRPASGLAPRYFDALVGKTLAKSMKKGQSLQWTDVSK